MKRADFYNFIILILCCGAFACTKSQNDWDETVSALIDKGAFSQADSLLDAVKRHASAEELRRADSLQEIIRRWRIEFPYDSVQIVEQIHARLSDTISSEQIARWEDAGQLEMRLIDGEKRYFRRAVGNLFHLVPELPDRTAASGNDPRIARLPIDRRLNHPFRSRHPSGSDHHSLHPDRTPERRTRRGYAPLLVALSTGDRSATNRHRTARLVPRDLYPRTGRDTPTKHLPRAGCTQRQRHPLRSDLPNGHPGPLLQSGLSNQPSTALRHNLRGLSNLYGRTTSTNFLLRSLGSQSPRAGRRRDQSRTDRIAHL